MRFISEILLVRHIGHCNVNIFVKEIVCNYELMIMTFEHSFELYYFNFFFFYRTIVEYF